MKKNILCIFIFFMIVISMSSHANVGKAQTTEEWIASLIESYKLSDEMHTSGIYTYRVVDESKKEIEIRGINSTQPKIEVPATLDGYRVLSVGYCGSIADNRAYYNSLSDALRIGGAAKDTLEEIVIPEGVRDIGPGAFQNFDKLKKVTLPKKGFSFIREYAFYECDNLNNLVIPLGVYLDKGAFYNCHSLNSIVLNNGCWWEAFDGKIKYINIIDYEKRGIDLWKLFSRQGSKVHTMRIDPTSKFLLLEPWTYLEIDKLIVNGKKTKLDFVDEYKSYKAKDWNGIIYTVSKSKASEFAKKNKISYMTKTAKNLGKIIKFKVKKGSKYRFTWKKAVTKIKTYSYDDGWDIVSKTIKTQYKVYGKKSKGEKYQLIKKTKKRSIITPYKYVKVVPVSTW